MNTPRGRDRRVEFFDLFSKSLRVRVVTSPAFAALTAAAKSVCIIAFVKCDNAKYHKRRLPDGRPVIKFSTSESKALLGISGPTHTAAMRQLVTHGFLDLIDHGGLIGTNGTASTFAPSKRWQSWQPEKPAHAGHGNIVKALAAKRAKKETPKPAKQPLQVDRSELHPGMEIFFYTDDRESSRKRARQGTLKEPLPGGGWVIQGKREAGKFQAPVFEVACDHIFTRAQLEEKRRMTDNQGRRTRRKQRAAASF